MDEDLKANVKKQSTWIRLIYMIFFIVFFNVAELFAGVVVVVQFLSKLFTGKANEQLSTFGQSLGIYLSEVLWFLTFHSETMPYPCRPWPSKAGGRAKAMAAQKMAESQSKTKVGKDTDNTKEESTKVKDLAESLFKKHGTKSAVIREMASNGYKRAEIAKAMGIRYQHVRNVLVTPLKGKQ